MSKRPGACVVIALTQANGLLFDGTDVEGNEEEDCCDTKPQEDKPILQFKRVSSSSHLVVEARFGRVDQLSSFCLLQRIRTSADGTHSSVRGFI